MVSLLFCKIGIRGEGIAPHGIDVGAQLSEALGIEAKVMTGAAPLFFDQAGGFEHFQVL